MTVTPVGLITSIMSTSPHVFIHCLRSNADLQLGAPPSDSALDVPRESNLEISERHEGQELVGNVRNCSHRGQSGIVITRRVVRTSVKRKYLDRLQPPLPPQPDGLRELVRAGQQQRGAGGPAGLLLQEPRLLLQQHHAGHHLVSNRAPDIHSSDCSSLETAICPTPSSSPMTGGPWRMDRLSVRNGNYCLEFLS